MGSFKMGTIIKRSILLLILAWASNHVSEVASANDLEAFNRLEHLMEQLIGRFDILEQENEALKNKTDALAREVAQTTITSYAEYPTSVQNIDHQNNRNKPFDKTVELALNMSLKSYPKSIMKFLKTQVALNSDNEDYQLQVLKDLGWSKINAFVNPPYAIYNETLYYFELLKMSHSKAKANCAKKFNGQGRLFQPRTADTCNKVMGLAYGTMGAWSWSWIGVDRIGRRGNGPLDFVYEGTTINPSFMNLYYRMNEGGDCVLAWKTGNSVMEWNAEPCTGFHYSICEKKKTLQ